MSGIIGISKPLPSLSPLKQLIPRAVPRGTSTSLHTASNNYPLTRTSQTYRCLSMRPSIPLPVHNGAGAGAIASHGGSAYCCWGERGKGMSSRRMRRRCYVTETANGRELTADDYILELQDLYDIAKDELEIAAESTASNTIYAVSDRITLREALDDLDYAYALYTGTKPLPPVIEVRNVSSSSSSSSSAAKSGSGSPDDDKEWVGQRRETNFDAGQVRAEVRGEIQRRVGQRVRELRHAVEALEESVHEGD